MSAPRVEGIERAILGHGAEAEVDVEVPKTQRPSSRYEPILVTEATRDIGSPDLFGIDVDHRARRQVCVTTALA